MSANMLELVKIFEQTLNKVPEIRYAGDPVLRRVCSQVSLEEGIVIGKLMEWILLNYRSVTGLWRGLAAPQIGYGKSVFVTFVDDKFETFINPMIAQRSESTNFYRELCISAGILGADVERPDWIVMEWMDEFGSNHREKFDWFKARLYQHEEAHLRGRLNLDDACDGWIMFATFDPRKEILRNER